MLGNVLHWIALGAGFLAGYLAGVGAWARGAGAAAGQLAAASLVPGAALTGLYLGLLAFLFRPRFSPARPEGLRGMAAPVGFTLSFLAGCGGIRSFLALLGG